MRRNILDTSQGYEIKGDNYTKDNYTKTVTWSKKEGKSSELYHLQSTRVKNGTTITRYYLVTIQLGIGRQTKIRITQEQQQFIKQIDAANGDKSYKVYQVTGCEQSAIPDVKKIWKTPKKK